MAAVAPRTITFAVWGPIERADLPGLSDRVCAALSDCHDAIVFCDVSGVPANAVTVDALTRLQLLARRRGCQVTLRNASAELLGLRDLMGLSDILPE